MKDFFNNLNKELEKFEWFANLGHNLGDELAEEAMTRSLQIKLNTVGQKIADYYLSLHSDVDIPEFMKTEDEKIENKVRKHLLRIYNEGSLDYWYQRAIEESEV